MKEQSSRRKPLLLAHRGTSLLAPENTAPAFDFAMRHGADVLEIDVRLSSDNEVMVFHDETLERTTNGTGLVREHTEATLKQLDAAYYFSLDGQLAARGTGVSMLSLIELLERYPIRVNIDIKDSDEQAVVAVANAVLNLQAADRCVLASFHDLQVERCRDLYPQLRTGMSLSEVKRYYFRFVTGQLCGDRHTAGLFQVPVSYYWLPLSGRRFIRSIHRGGGEINYWTINDPVQMKQLIARGADGIVTDRADLACEVISSSVID